MSIGYADKIGGDAPDDTDSDEAVVNGGSKARAWNSIVWQTRCQREAGALRHVCFMHAFAAEMAPKRGQWGHGDFAR